MAEGSPHCYRLHPLTIARILVEQVINGVALESSIFCYEQI